VILIPGELVGLDPQVLCSFISHGVLDPEYRLIPRIHGSVMVDSGELHNVFFVAANVYLEKCVRTVCGYERKFSFSFALQYLGIKKGCML